jgi:hypothetical protein
MPLSNHISSSEPNEVDERIDDVQYALAIAAIVASDVYGLIVITLVNES